MAAEKNTEKNYAIVLLAAGGSSRLGHPKQLLSYQGQSLLQYSLGEALASGAGPVVVVLGANAETLQAQIKTDNVHVVVNEAWQEGMASSIRSGVKAVAEINPSAKGLILMVCDQPFVTAPLLNELITAHQKTGKGIVTCSYEDTYGPPVFFHASLFPELRQLKGDIGARSIVRQHTEDVEAIPFPEGNVDIDTDADYEKLKRETSP